MYKKRQHKHKNILKFIVFIYFVFICYEIFASSKIVFFRNRNSYLNSLTNNVILYLFQFI